MGACLNIVYTQGTSRVAIGGSKEERVDSENNLQRFLIAFRVREVQGQGVSDPTLVF